MPGRSASARANGPREGRQVVERQVGDDEMDRQTVVLVVGLSEEEPVGTRSRDVVQVADPVEAAGVDLQDPVTGGAVVLVGTQPRVEQVATQRVRRPDQRVDALGAARAVGVAPEGGEMLARSRSWDSARADCMGGSSK